MSVRLEVAAFDLDSALRAAGAGADRIELCRDADAGGLTPPLGWVEAVTQRTGVPVVAMIRSHGDGWTFTDAEHAAMRADARSALAAGTAGVVWGALRPDGTLDADALRALVETVAPHEVVVHRAFDAARNIHHALDVLLSVGVARVLTGGGPGPAVGNLDRLAHLVARAGDDLTVMPGGGIRAQNVADVVRQTGAREAPGARAPGASTVVADEVLALHTALRPLDA